MPELTDFEKREFRAIAEKIRKRDEAEGYHNGEQRSAANGSRPKIVLGCDEYRINDEAIAALSDPITAPEIFQRGHQLVRVLRASKARKQCRLDRPEGTPRIAALPNASICELLSRVASFCKIKQTAKGSKEIPAHPPDRTVAAIAARGVYPAVRDLAGVVETPTLRPDGSVLDTPGWDSETGLFYEPNADFPQIPQNPSRKQALDAAAHLLNIVSDFPFAGETEDEQSCHRAAWLSAALTPLVRFAIDGPCPIFVFDGNCPGTGKSLLTDLVSHIVTSRPMSRTTFPNDEDELRKRLTAVALVGDRLMLFDNIDPKCRFGGAALDAALTATMWKDRILGKSKLTDELPLITTFFASGNNIQIGADLQRRAILCRLESRLEKPEERDGFRYPNLLEHVRAHRPQLIHDAITLIRAFVVAGSPQAKLPAFGSFEGWSRLVRQSIYWLTDVDPCSPRRLLRLADPAFDNLSILLEGWSELPGSKVGVSVAEVTRILNDPQQKDNFPTLREALAEWSSNEKIPGPGIIGYKLRGFRKRVVNGRMIDSVRGHGGGQRWRVVQAR